MANRVRLSVIQLTYNHDTGNLGVNVTNASKPETLMIVHQFAAYLSMGMVRESEAIPNIPSPMEPPPDANGNVQGVLNL